MLVVLFQCSFNDLSENSKRSRYSCLDPCSHCVCESQDSEQPPLLKVQIQVDFEIQALMRVAVCSWFLNFGWEWGFLHAASLDLLNGETQYIQISFALNWVSSWWQSMSTFALMRWVPGKDLFFRFFPLWLLKTLILSLCSLPCIAYPPAFCLSKCIWCHSEVTTAIYSAVIR